MKFTHTLALLLLSTSLSVYSVDSINLASNMSLIEITDDLFTDTKQQNSNNNSINYSYSNNEISLPTVKDNWINIDTNTNRSKYSVSTDKNLTFGNEVSFAWSFTKFLKVNLNVFANQFQDNGVASTDNFAIFDKSADKSFSQDLSNDINRSISGYKFGISSELGLGHDYKLGLNLDYGQLEGADLMGFNSDEISTTSFALGIRKSKFGASLNTDIYLEEDINMFDSSRLGFEIDWHFSEDSKISLGSKQRMNNSVTETNNSINGLTGNVQYIKFQHNL